jgi:hypothetical protein
LDREELVGLMRQAPGSFRTLRATIRWTSDPLVRENLVSEELRESVAPRPQGLGRLFRWFTVRGSVERWAGPRLDELHEQRAKDAAARGPEARTTRLWIERPGRLREEVEGKYSHVHVSDGTREVYVAPVSGVVVLEGPPDRTDPVAVTAGVTLAEERELEPIGETDVAGRHGVRVRCADDRELVVDVECGLVLRDETRFEGAPLAVREVLELELDGTLDPALFVYEPGPGERVRSTSEPSYAVELLVGLEQAAAEAPFRVFLPREPGRGMHLVAGDANPDRSVSAVYMHETTEALIELDERAADPSYEPDRRAERVEVAGIEAFVRRYRRTGQIVVELVRDGTHVEVSSSDLGRDELLLVASSLERVD